MHAVGRDAVVELFLARSALGPSSHVTHDRIVTFDAADPDRAKGLVLSHAEMRVSDEPMVSNDPICRRLPARQRALARFAERRLHLMYYSRAAACRESSRRLPGQSNLSRMPASRGIGRATGDVARSIRNWPARRQLARACAFPRPAAGPMLAMIRMLPGSASRRDTCRPQERPTMNRVQGKVAIITGAAAGLGRADAIALVNEGAKVVVTDINETMAARSSTS
jgi:3-oxoacyl-ACP reductase-like protein